MRSDRVVLFALTALLCLTGAAPALGQDVGPLIERVLEAYGGRERLEQVHSYRFEASMHALVRDQQAAVERSARWPGLLEVVIHYPDQVEIRRLSEGRGWRGPNRQALEEVQGPMLNSMRTQAIRASLPWVLAQLEDRVELIDTTEESYLLGLRLGGDAAVRFWIETATDRVVRTEAIVDAGQAVMIFATDFSDFRDVDGVLFPFHEETWAQGTHTASVDVTLVEWNPPEGPEPSTE